MRSIICVAFLFGISAIFLLVHDMLSRTIMDMLYLIIGSLVCAGIAAFFILRWAESKNSSYGITAGRCGLAVFVFFGCWVILWFTSEQLLIDHYLRVRGGGDTGYNYFYPGASGMGYAEGLSQPLKILQRVFLIGGGGAFFLTVPFSMILTAFKPRSEQIADGKTAEALKIPH